MDGFIWNCTDREGRNITGTERCEVLYCCHCKSAEYGTGLEQKWKAFLLSFLTDVKEKTKDFGTDQVRHARYSGFTREFYTKVSELNYSVIDSFIKKPCSLLMPASCLPWGIWMLQGPDGAIILQTLQWSCFGVQHSGLWISLEGGHQRSDSQRLWVNICF